jgi:hypothetical protein
LAHNLASFEFHRGARWNNKTAAGLIGVSTDARLGQARLKNAKVAELNRDIASETVGNFIKRPLDYIEDLMLDHASLVAYGDDDVALG